jgi:hypothetical protein
VKPRSCAGTADNYRGQEVAGEHRAVRRCEEDARKRQWSKESSQGSKDSKGKSIRREGVREMGRIRRKRRKEKRRR